MMRRDLESLLSTSGDDVYLTVGGDQWRLSVTGARRLDPDWFVHLVALGPRAVTFTVRVGDSPLRIATVRRILGLIAEWLRAGDGREHVFLELSKAH